MHVGSTRAYQERLDEEKQHPRSEHAPWIWTSVVIGSSGWGAGMTPRME